MWISGAVESSRVKMKYSPLGGVISQLDCIVTQGEDLLNLLALLSGALGLVVAEEELPVEQLDADHSKDEQEEDVDDEDIEDIFEGNHDAVEDGLEGRHPVDHLERTQHTQ